MQVQEVKHSVASSNIRSLAWVGSTIVYAFGGTSASVYVINKTYACKAFLFCEFDSISVINKTKCTQGDLGRHQRVG